MLQLISAQSMYQELSDITINNKTGGQCYIPEQSMYQELERQYKKTTTVKQEPECCS